MKGEYDNSLGYSFSLFPSVGNCLIDVFTLEFGGGRFDDNFSRFLRPEVGSDFLCPSGVVGGGGELGDLGKHGGRHFMI